MPDAASGTVDEHRLAVEGHRLVPGGLERIWLIVAKLDQELPCCQKRHRRAGRMNMVDAGWFQRNMRCRHTDIMRVGIATRHQVIGEANHCMDLVADAEL